MYDVRLDSILGLHVRVCVCYMSFDCGEIVCLLVSVCVVSRSCCEWSLVPVHMSPWKELYLRRHVVLSGMLNSDHFFNSPLSLQLY